MTPLELLHAFSISMTSIVSCYWTTRFKWLKTIRHVRKCVVGLHLMLQPQEVTWLPLFVGFLHKITNPSQLYSALTLLSLCLLCPLSHKQHFVDYSLFCKLLWTKGSSSQSTKPTNIRCVWLSAQQSACCLWCQYWPVGGTAHMQSAGEVGGRLNWSRMVLERVGSMIVTSLLEAGPERAQTEHWSGTRNVKCKWLDDRPVER